MGIILWAPPVDTVRVQSTVTQTEVLCFNNYSGLLAFELVFSFSFIQLSLSLLFLLFVFEQHEENDEHERQQVFVGFAWFLSGVFFYAPWCGHCKKAKPEWAEAAKMLEEDNIPLFAVNLDEDENRPLAQKYQIQGFPTIMIFKKDKLDTPLHTRGQGRLMTSPPESRLFPVQLPPSL